MSSLWGSMVVGSLQWWHLVSKSLCPILGCHWSVCLLEVILKIQILTSQVTRLVKLSGLFLDLFSWRPCCRVYFQTNFCNLLVGNKDLNCYLLYLMLLGITKRNVIRKSRFYFSCLLLILISPRMHCMMSRWGETTKAALRTLRVETSKWGFSRLYRCIDKCIDIIYS
jgi:hypothetical protein